MDVTESGMVMDASEVQPLNAEDPMEVTDPERVMEVRKVQSLNAEEPMDVIVSAKTTFLINSLLEYHGASPFE